MKLTTALLSGALLVNLTGIALAADQKMTEQDVLDAQKEWTDALIAISKAHDEEGPDKAREVAVAAIGDIYNYDNAPVLFKPTLAAEPHRFRTTEDGAIAYFVGGSSDFPEDSGFALKGWREASIDNAAIFTEGNIGISMGDVTLTDADGNQVSVDKTWGFQKLDNGDVVMILHHSSIPFEK